MAEYLESAPDGGVVVTDGSIDTKDGRAVIAAALKKIAAKQIRVQKFNKYYFGQHPLIYSSEKFTTEFANRLQSFRDNLCPTCVKAPADRLEVIGFAADQSSDIYKTSWETWKRNQMPRVSREVHRDAFRTADAYVVVWQGEDGTARIHKQDVRQCTVFYDMETDTIEAGAKLWAGLDKNIYLTLYFTDRLEKYVTKNPQSAGNVPTTAAAFVKRQVPGENWPLPNDTGICPMFHFGRETSILDDVIPLNDALNKTIADLLVSSESNSLRQRWSTGISYEINPETGKQVIPWENQSAWFAANDVGAKFGSFQDSKLDEYLKAADWFTNAIASVSGIPKYYFDLEGGSMPSGEALRKAESRFTALIADAQLDFGETWSRVMQFALGLDNIQVETDAAAASDAAQKILFETQWTPADPMSANEKADLAIKKKNVGVSKTVALSELGYTDAQITAMKKETDAEAATAADNFSKTFNAGPQNG